MKKKKIIVTLLLFVASSLMVTGVIKNINVQTNNAIVVLAEDDLEQRKEEACQEIRDYVDPSDYEEPYCLEIIGLIDEYVTKIGFVNEIETIESLIEEFRDRVNWIINGIPHGPGDDTELEKAKEDAFNYISYYLHHNSDVYYVFEAEIDVFLDELKTKISTATTVDEVEDFLKQFDKKMAEYPSDPDAYLVQLKYDLHESFIDYLGRTSIELGAHLSEDDFDWLLETFDDDLRYLNTRQEIMDRYYGAMNFAYDFMKKSGGDTTGKGSTEGKNDNGKTALIVACSIEGGIILAGAALGLALLIKKKKY